MIHYSKKLDTIFTILIKNNIKPIIVGGYVRDFYLGIESKDIDVELYNLDSFEVLEKILKEFGEVNSVGKSFGVCKLTYDEDEIDFSLPRIDSKIASGHKGFKIDTSKELDFNTATKRRDFTINAIGFDIQNKKILDPFDGQKDLQKKLLKAVDITTFTQDPLRVLRGVGFASRFQFTLDENLFNICKKMCIDKELYELPKERIFEEIKKILLKSPKPSKGFELFSKLKFLPYLKPLDTLNQNDFQKILNSLDRYKDFSTLLVKKDIVIMLAILSSKFNPLEVESFIINITNQKNILNDVKKLVSINTTNKFDDIELYQLSSKIILEDYLIYFASISNISKSNFNNLYKRAKDLKILHKPPKPLVMGRDLIKLGIKPSPKFAKILNIIYQDQLNLKIKTKDEAISSLKRLI